MHAIAYIFQNIKSSERNTVNKQNSTMKYQTRSTTVKEISAKITTGKCLFEE